MSVREICQQYLIGDKWEFNLRDLLRVCELYESNGNQIDNAVDLIYFARINDSQILFEIIKSYNKIFGHEFDLLKKMTLPQLTISNSKLFISQIGSVQCHTKVLQIEDGSSQKFDVEIVNYTLYYLPQLVELINLNWPILITGATSSGKSSIVKTLANISNHKLVEIRLGSTTDSSELIGNYDQDDIQRQYSEFTADFINFLRKDIMHNLMIHSSISLLAVINYLQRCLGELQLAKGMLLTKESHHNIHELIMKILHYLEQNQAILSPCITDFTSKLEQMTSTTKQLQVLISDKKQNTQGFSWFHSELINAIQSGSWVLLENIGGCNSAILERLNPIFERTGYLYINECGSVNGKTVKVALHPDFRLFLILNPEQDKISRSLRNRCVELCIRSPITSNETISESIENYQLDELLTTNKRANEIIKVNGDDSGVDISTFPKTYNRFLVSIYQGDLRKLAISQLYNSIEYPYLIKTLVMINFNFYNEVHRMKGSVITFEYGTFSHMLKLIKQNSEQCLNLKSSLEQAFQHAYLPILLRNNVIVHGFNFEMIVQKSINQSKNFNSI